MFSPVLYLLRKYYILLLHGSWTPVGTTWHGIKVQLILSQSRLKKKSTYADRSVAQQLKFAFHFHRSRVIKINKLYFFFSLTHMCVAILLGPLLAHLKMRWATVVMWLLRQSAYCAASSCYIWPKYEERYAYASFHNFWLSPQILHYSIAFRVKEWQYPEVSR